MARDAHKRVARAEKLSCCGITFGSSMALRLHKREHRNRVYPD